MKKITYLFLLCTFTVFAQGSLKKTDVAGKVKLLVPEEMSLLTPEQMEQQFGLAKAPLAVFQDRSTHVSLSINERVDSLSQGSKIDYKSTGEGGMDYSRDLELEKQFYKASLSSWFSNAKFLQDTIVTIKKKQVIVFEMEGEIEGANSQGKSRLSKNYTYLEYILLDNRRYTITFNCPLDKKSYWKPMIDKTMASIKVK